MSSEKVVEVLNDRGLHLSSAAKIAKLAGRFACDVQMVKGELTANAKSVLNITGLMAPKGTKIKIITDGVDEAEAVEAMARLFEDRFEEAQ